MNGTMSLWAGFIVIATIARRLCHSSAMRSISGFVLTVNHYYGHSVHILSMKMFVPFHSFILMMPQPPTPPYHRIYTSNATMVDNVLENLYQPIYAQAIKWMESAMFMKLPCSTKAMQHIEYRIRHSRHLKRTSKRYFVMNFELVAGTESTLSSSC